MKVKSVETRDGQTVETWEDHGPVYVPAVDDDLDGIELRGYVTGVRVA